MSIESPDELRSSLMAALRCLDKTNSGMMPPEPLKMLLRSSSEAQMQENEIVYIFAGCRTSPDGSQVRYSDVVDAVVARMQHVLEPQEGHEASSSKVHLVEAGVRFSQSLLWRLLPLWYEEAGQRAWGVEAVPSYITSNAYIARTYCHLFVAFVRDLQRRHLRQPGGGKAGKKPFDPRRCEFVPTTHCPGGSDMPCVVLPSLIG